MSVNIWKKKISAREQQKEKEWNYVELSKNRNLADRMNGEKREAEIFNVYILKEKIKQSYKKKKR